MTMTEKKRADVLADLTRLVNRHALENGSNTPDFVIASFLLEQLESFDRATSAREGWYGRELTPGIPVFIADPGEEDAPASTSEAPAS